MRAPAKQRVPLRLLLDVGNSRLKWQLVRPDAKGPRSRSLGAVPVRGSFTVDSLRRSVRPLVHVLRRSSPEATIYVCNVAGPTIERRIREAAAAAGLRAPRFIRTAASAAGVVNGYVEAWRLGVDRWVALIGAHHQQPGRNLCIVSIGSAMTIDLLTADGRHQGGSIAPGPYLMLDALLQSTAGIRRRAGANSAAALTRAASATAARKMNGLFARDTSSALLAGCLHACAELIERGLVEGRKRLGARPELIVTGGGADCVMPLLRSRYRREDNLVLHGLAVLAGEHSAR
jgi:type III pantothenate kinase